MRDSILSEALPPTVVFMDEIEQVPLHTPMNPEEHQHPFPRALINAISDASLHGSVIWVGASQRPDLMPPIFRRYGLFDTKLIMLPPTGGRQSRNFKNCLSRANVR